MTDRPAGPVLIDREGEAPSPAEAPPPPDPGLLEARAMQGAARIATARLSGVARLFWTAVLAFAGFAVSLAVWDYVAGLMARSTWLGGAALGALTLAGLAAGVIALRELAALRRLGRVEGLRARAAAALLAEDPAAARRVAAETAALYADRPETAPARAELSRRGAEVFDAGGIVDLAEELMLAPPDAAARREIEAAVRQVAAVTALMPVPLVDVGSALVANLRMIRRIAEGYAGRAGTLGGWRLTRAVLAHLVATGLMAVGDDLIGSAVGGGIVGKLSRRFGEGVMNGALTARVGIAAMEVCRPLPFRRLPPPKVAGLMSRALSGLFERAGQEAAR